MIAQIKVGLIIVALVGAAGGVYYVKKLQHDNEVLVLNQAKLETAITEQQEVLKVQKESYEEILVANTNLNKLNIKLNTAKATLQKKLADHDINFLATEKPKLIEKVINKGSLKVMNDIEDITK
jgi:hypothetical protein|tara:strand:- start:1003 stop:1374 length:372 start_codon:yes stop_codon:yes gene_type:complete